MLILTEQTPNPDAMTFRTEVALTEGAAWTYRRDEPPSPPSPLAVGLLDLTGVREVFIAQTFVTVLRESSKGPWTDLRYQILAVLADHLGAGVPAVERREATPQNADGPLAAEIRNVLARHVRPGVARDGGDVQFVGFEASTGVLTIRMLGACGGCPSAAATLKATVEGLVRRYVPEVLQVVELRTPAGTQTQAKPSWLKGLANTVGRPGGRTRFTHNGV
jgi:Fe-S cluster biogenesis protein NfuA